jgi:hypothetical protein
MGKRCQNAPKVGSSGAFSRTSSRTPHCHLPQFLSHCLLSHLKYLAQHLISSLAYPAKHPDPYQGVQDMKLQIPVRPEIVKPPRLRKYCILRFKEAVGVEAEHVSVLLCFFE